MIRPDPAIVQMVARVATHYPDLVKWPNDWRQQELEQLPNVSTAVATAQGRCQVLTELCKLVNQSRDLAAQSNKR